MDVFGPWVLSEPAPDSSVETWVYRIDEAAFLALDRVDWKILIDVDPHQEGVRLAAHDWVGFLDWQADVRGAFWTPMTAGQAFSDLFENYFRILVAYRLLFEGGLLVHSAGVMVDGEGYLFPGASGHGKSTLSRISLREGRVVLSDDGNALWRKQGRTQVQALPFGGELRDLEKPVLSFPLRTVAALRKGSGNGLTVRSRAQATALLFSCAPFVNGDPLRQERLFSNIDRLLDGVSSRCLTFHLDGGFWDLLLHDTGPSSEEA